MIHVWAGLFVCIGIASSRWMINENFQIYSTWNTTIGATLNIALNYILIINVGVLGAAVATLIAYSVSAYFSLLLWKKTKINFYLISKSAIGF